MHSESHMIPDGTPPEIQGDARGIVLCTGTGEIVGWNVHAQALTGWEASDMLGQPVTDLLIAGSDESIDIGSLLQRCQASSPSARHTLTALLRHRSGKNVPAALSISALASMERTCFALTLDQPETATPDLLSRPGMRQDDPHWNGTQFDHVHWLDQVVAGIAVINPQGVIRFWNAALESLFCYSREAVLGMHWQTLVLAEPEGQCEERHGKLMQSGEWDGSLVFRTGDGSSKSFASSWRIATPGAKEASDILVTFHEPPQKSASPLMHYDAWRHDRESFDALFGHHPDGVFALHKTHRLAAVNTALASLTGYSPVELTGMLLVSLVAPPDRDAVQAALCEAVDGKPRTMEVTCLGKNGTPVDVAVTLLPHFAGGAVNGLHGIVKDIAHRKRDERRIQYLATHDALTELPNRNLLHQHIELAVAEAVRNETRFGVLFMDLNRFKVINDSLGHDQGDLLLRTVAQRLRHVMREGDTVARIGGDEFVILAHGVGDVAEIERVAQQLLEAICEPVELAGTLLSVSTSIGAALFPEDGTDTVTLLKNADLAMYAAKEYGMGKVCRYEPQMNTRAVARLMHETSLRHAIAHGELILHYQPRLDIASNRIAGIEALVRWDHPGRGLIFPDHFIELAEETGMIESLGEWVLIHACRQMQQWREAGLGPVKVSINVSALQLQSERLCGAVWHALDVSGLDPETLELEITESSLMQNLSASNDKLEAFRAMGVKLAIDDFGTGYSSLNYLKRLPIDTLKIDKSFVRDLADDRDDAAIVRATIAMAHSMGLKVVAEGVTSSDQMRVLEAAHCDEIQGYLFCQPLPAAEIEAFFRNCEQRGIRYSWPH